MREILFRGKPKNLKSHQWVHGQLLHHSETISKIYSDELDYPVGVIPDTVGQFTGSDKNGKKIFEGDIGRYKQTDGATQNGKSITCIGKVIYNAKTASFAVESKDEAGRKYFDYFPIKDFEVIGNIHDNPELLEVNGNANH